MKLVSLSIAFLGMFIGAYSQINDSSRREIKLQGAVNFRDLGGYKVKDGRHIKWGKIYRSAALDHLTPEDLNKLQQLSFAYVIDFRGPYEVKAAPDRIPASATRISLPAGSENVGDSNYMKHMVQSMQNDSSILQFYGNLAPFHDRYQPLFAELLQVNKDSAVLFHCTAGKDRTGIAAALILYALGVDEKTIIEDYLATNYYRRNENVRAVKGMVKQYKIEETAAQNLMLAKENYLRATFTSIEKQYGTLDAYLEKVMGLSKSSRELLQNKYLEFN